ncbi:DUF2023 family protein [Dysgonomonas sp. OttesenSCG-928-M03]|nr:DUF2023 family protein [Dysgonomonas sp. OttesenSCG-928-M03]
MQVFNHHIYEFKKGVRDMVLCTLLASYEDKVKAKLDKNEISYMIQRQRNGNINVFFGKKECLIVANTLCENKTLDQLTPEEDFMLGILLGYNICEQCTRYCKRRKVIMP